MGLCGRPTLYGGRESGTTGMASTVAGACALEATQPSEPTTAYLFAYRSLALGPLVAVVIKTYASLLEGVRLAPLRSEHALGDRFWLLGSTGPWWPWRPPALTWPPGMRWCARQGCRWLARLQGAEYGPVPAYFSRGVDGAERGMRLTELIAFDQIARTADARHSGCKDYRLRANLHCPIPPRQ